MNALAPEQIDRDPSLCDRNGCEPPRRRLPVCMMRSSSSLIVIRVSPSVLFIRTFGLRKQWWPSEGARDAVAFDHLETFLDVCAAWRAFRLAVVRVDASCMPRRRWRSSSCRGPCRRPARGPEAAFPFARHGHGAHHIRRPRRRMLVLGDIVVDARRCLRGWPRSAPRASGDLQVGPGPAGRSA